MKKVTNTEFAWYLGCGVIVFLGLVAIIFGIIGYHMVSPTGMNFIQSFEEKIKIDLRYLGLIFVGSGVAILIVVLLYNAKKADREVEKKIRREQRLAAQSNKTMEVKQAVEVIEEKPTVEVSEAPKAE